MVPVGYTQVKIQIQDIEWVLNVAFEVILINKTDFYVMNRKFCGKSYVKATFFSFAFLKSGFFYFLTKKC